MTDSRAFLVHRQAADAPWQVLAGGDRTDGQVVIGDAVLPPRTAGPGLHVHSREDEAMYVIEGVMTVRVGERTFEAGPGSLVWLPRGEPHTFANLSDAPARTVGVITPAGLEGMFRETHEYLSSLSGPPDPARLAEIGAAYGVTALGPGLL
jgi:mannose-6-phosphate isomerase-like protein (cupin superfamily)